MVESLIKALIVLCIVVAAIFLFLWVLAEIGVVLPAMVVKVLWIVVALVALLFIWRAVRGTDWRL